MKMNFLPLSFKRWAKNGLSEWVARHGYQISKIKAFDENTGLTAFDIQARVIGDAGARAIIFDVGANRGQTTARYRALFPAATIHAFEPVREFFQTCLKNTVGDDRVIMNNIALSDTEGEVMFHETIGGQSSSVLPQGDLIPYYFAAGDFTESRSYPVKTRSIDSYCLEAHIGQIDILKLDTEGFELNVLKGASRLLQAGRIRVIYSEVNFERFWEKCALYHHLAAFLENFGMDLFALYNVGAGALGATKSGDALFVRHEEKRRMLADAAAKARSHN
jgi:FkbM family methyltransferase